MIDWARVRELKDDIGEEDFAQVARLFISEVDDVIARLIASPDPASLEQDLHFMKSSALNLGFSEMADLCQQGETRAAARQSEAISLTPIFAAYEAAKAEFLA